MQHRSGRTGRAGNKGTSVLLVPASRRRKAEMLIAEAKVEAIWAGPPTPEEIRALDQERLLNDPMLTGDADEDDAGMVEALLAGRTGQEIAAALVRVYRSRLPGAEEVGDPNFARDERRPREPRDYAGGREGARFGEDRSDSPRSDGPRKAGPRGDTVWFRLNIGRKDGADPRQLLPMLCRRGKITRDEVGAIRIFDSETKVEIDAAVAERFADLAKAVDRDKIVIEPVTGEDERRPAKPFGEKASHAPAPYQKSTRRDDRPAPRERSERPAYDKPAFEKKPYEGKKKPYEGKSKPFAPAESRSYDPVAQDRQNFGDPSVRVSREARPGADKPYAPKPYASKGKPGGKFGTGGKPGFSAAKPFTGGKTGKPKRPRDDRG